MRIRSPWRVRAVRVGVVVAVAFLVGGAAPLVRDAGADTPVFTAQKSVARANLDNGTDTVVDTRTVSVSVSATQNLRDRQGVTVTWKGAHPTGGLITDHNSGAAAQMEYPVVIMQCRGIDSATAAATQQVSPQTCWTQTPDERFAFSPSGFIYPSYRMDRYAKTADRAITVNQPKPLPAACPALAATHWVPFVAVDGTVYPGGRLGCAGLAPEAANSADSLQPGNTTYGVSDAAGNGSTKFVMQNADTNASLGCSEKVACTLEIIPIEGISCDPAGTASGAGLGMPVNDQPEADLVPTVATECEKKGHFAPGAANGGAEVPDVAVTGSLWWSASNWQNRISVPLTFAPSASVCNVVNNSAQVLVYGSEAVLQATQQWSPSFCLDPKLFVLRHVQTSEPQAKNLLNTGNIEAAFQAAPPPAPFAKPVVQAPAAVSAWAIAYSIDGPDGNTTGTLKLDARLLAKLLSESYISCADCLKFTSNADKAAGYDKMAANPEDMSRDPEFQALNPGIPVALHPQSAATLAFMSSDSDVMHSLTAYINSDPEARAWLNGTPDPWGMVVNPAYKNITLPVDNWPLLDTHLPVLASGANVCIANSPVPWLPLVASPVSNPSIISLDLQFDIANSQTVCQNNGQQNQKLTGIGREAPGTRFILGLVSLADAQRYELNVAQLQTQRASTSTDKFTDASGRSFVGPTDGSLVAAARAMTPDDALGTWTMPYDSLRTAPALTAAYPGTMLLSIDVPTSGVPVADAQHLGQLLTFIGGPGQTAGIGNGKLPPGYLPMSDANGLGSFSSYTVRAAAAVAAQHCATLYPSGKATTFAAGCTPTTVTGGTGQMPPPAVPAPIASTANPVAGSSPPLATSPAKLVPQAASAAPATTAPKTVAVGHTSTLSTGPYGLVLPFAALLGGVFLSLFAWRMGVGRR